MANEKTLNGGGGASTQSNSIDSKASVLSGYSLSTSAQTIVSAINEILPKATGVGKVDPNSNGTGEIFNCYESDSDFTANQATGRFTHAEGVNNVASGFYCHVEGTHNVASRSADHAEGQGCKASGGSSHAEGFYCTTTNQGEHAEGKYNLSHSNFDIKYLMTYHSVGIGSSEDDRKNAHEIMANGDHYIYGLGGYDGTKITDAQTLQEVINGKQDTLVSGTSIKTINGESLLGSGDIEITGGTPSGVGKVDPNSDGTGEIFNSYEGDNANVASGNYSHAEGNYTNATGNCSHAEGYGTSASENYSHAEGTRTKANGYNSHAEGEATTAFGSGSHAEGVNNKAFGACSHAEGNITQASGQFSHTEGCGTRAYSKYEHAEGAYNKSYSNPSAQVIHSVGIGSDDNNRKNAHEIKFNGDHYIYGVGGFDGTNSADAQSLQTVLSNLGPNIIEVPELTGDYNIPANATKREFLYIINIGATLYSVTGDSAIKWAGGIAPNPSANSVLVVSILNNLATWNVFMSV